MIINNPTNSNILNSYNMQQKVDITHSIRIETSYVQSGYGGLKDTFLYTLIFQ